MDDDVKLLSVNANTEASETVNVCEENESQNDDDSSYMSSTSSSDDSSSESDSESDGSTNKSTGTSKVKNGENVCIAREKLFPRLVWGPEYNTEKCGTARQRVCPTCLSEIRVFWDTFFEKRQEIPEKRRREYDHDFFSTICVEKKAINIANFLYLYEEAANSTIEFGDLQGLTFYRIISGHAAADTNWAINYLQSHTVWKGFSNKSFVLDIALFFVYPHIYQCWPHSSPFVKYVRAYQQKCDYKEIWGKTSNKNERYLYKGTIKFLATFFSKHKFQIVSSLVGMQHACHSINSGWGTTKRPFFFFKGEEVPKGLTLET